MRDETRVDPLADTEPPPAEDEIENDDSPDAICRACIEEYDGRRPRHRCDRCPVARRVQEG